MDREAGRIGGMVFGQRERQTRWHVNKFRGLGIKAERETATSTITHLAALCSAFVAVIRDAVMIIRPAGVIRMACDFPAAIETVLHEKPVHYHISLPIFLQDCLLKLNSFQAKVSEEVAAAL